MADDKPTAVTPAPTAPIKPASPPKDWQAAKAKLALIEQHLKANEGKNGVNPFKWRIDNNFNKLVAAVADTRTQTDEVYASIMKLPASPDVSVKVYEDKSVLKAAVAQQVPKGVKPSTGPTVIAEDVT